MEWEWRGERGEGRGEGREGEEGENIEVRRGEREGGNSYTCDLFAAYCTPLISTNDTTKYTTNDIQLPHRNRGQGLTKEIRSASNNILQ